jgi:hypothetical protein
LSIAFDTSSDFGKPEPYSHARQSRTLEASVLDRARHPVVRACPAEREEVPARLEDAEGFDGPRLAPRLERAHLLSFTVAAFL